MFEAYLLNNYRAIWIVVESFLIKNYNFKRVSQWYV